MRNERSVYFNPNLLIEERKGPAPLTEEERQCNICLSDYDRHLHLPLIVCHSHHTLCKECCEDINGKGNPVCPFCREELIEEQIVNQRIAKALAPSYRESQVNRRVEYIEYVNIGRVQQQ